ncbi:MULTISPECIES: selenide, water dikinase SelD [Paracoccus]|jgi:selenide,water dikinase|uniref:Selenide, water dikinase n=1 Tax=Paracoccus denitrificans (strain Pd 1222) TaxID=318586 RepID=A1B5L3_PARDP|nr:MULTISPECIES: selenide, water dikinase SelD [Paracoccus]ABL70807.1 selenophosphate synthase [Paracoccus denitrificans PD1222]MBB4627607.1 selenide,water dikinase [Paracoccus denitrificans]MCU7429041.1 selenide, water dikinase SelD [Paracoccus denitrificans]QAR26130.1 selenide, water dikinase SelD [Paracoccus denitrificans]UPV95044.1 selenide, water dikinase SelD [Paracoccus denitrificans]
MNDLPRLTSLAHGGGCGCKLAPSVLRELLADQPMAQAFPQLLVGTETSDDAAVWQVDDNTCVIATTDFFMPMVDDPRAFGRIAATNAISDIYAMGGRPIMALAILGMPIDKLAPERIREILEGGREICHQAGIPVAGGHSIDAPEPIYGLAVIGLCHPSELRRNADARPGDALILTKGLGVGIYSAAIKKGALDEAGVAEMVASATTLNRVGADLAKRADVHAITDVTGFGILGHGLEIARGARLRLRLRLTDLPLLSRAAELAEAGFVTGASTRNWAAYGAEVALPEGLPLWQRALLTDPQTSGGLLVACAPEAAGEVLDFIRDAGFPLAAIVGHAEQGVAGISVE